MNFLLPDYARRLLRDEHLEVAEAEAERLGVRLRPAPQKRWLRWMRDERESLVSALRSAGSDETKTGEVIDNLGKATVVFGPNDPTLEVSATPWLYVVKHLLVVDAKLASRAARAWFQAIDVAGMETDDGIPNRTFIANLTGVVSAHAAENVKAEYMFMFAQVMAEGLDENETAPFLQACRWVREAIRSSNRP